MTRTLATELTRIRGHFDGALALLDTRDTHALDPAARLTRQLLRQALVEYQSGGVFPLNHDFATGLRPTFVDDHGTRCAMAHLMELGGAGDLVSEVAAKANHAYVDELAADPRFGAWLEAAGLTVEEAARIQPGYGCVPAADCLCTIATPTGGAARAVVEASITATSSTENKITAKVDVLHGDSTVKVGDSITATRYRSITTKVGDKVLVALEKVQGEYEVLTLVGADGKLGDTCGASVATDPFPNQSGRGAVGPLTVTDLLALRAGSVDACTNALEKRDKCFGTCGSGGDGEPGGGGGGSCVYGAGGGPTDAGPDTDAARSTDTWGTSGGVTTTPSGDAGKSGFPSTSATPGSTDDDGGCSTTGGSAPASVAVLLAVVGAMLARRRLAR